MTATPILESLAREFSVEPEAMRAVFEMIDAGLSAPFIGRFRRSRTGGLTESQVRRLEQRRQELTELDRRRGTILRTLERDESLATSVLEGIRTCMDRFELEDLFVPHRRPEPEVQLALDRGLGALADLLVKPTPRAERPKPQPNTKAEASAPTSDAPASGDAAAAEPTPPADESSAAPQEGATVVEGTAAPDADAAPPAGDVTPPAEAATSEDAAQADAATADAATADAASADAAQADAAQADAAQADAAQADAAPANEPTADGAVAQTPKPGRAKTAKPRPAPQTAPLHHAVPERFPITPELARLCQPFVDPDKGIHTESEALSGAVRILSDRLGRSAHLRGLVRRMMLKRGVLRVRPLMDGGKAGRHKPLLKINQPLRQLQGHKLIAIRQAQKERVLNTVITLDPGLALPKIRAAMGKHTQPAFDDLLSEIARQALGARLLPVVEADVRLELKERGDAEALRFLSQHLRQLLLTPVYGRHPVVGVDVNAKGDWNLACIAGDGSIVAKAKIEVGEKDDKALGEELRAALEGSNARLLGAGQGRTARSGIVKLRAAVVAAGLELAVTVVNEAGLSSYANSELARNELGDCSVPERMAVSLGRRMQDPMAEFLKVDPRHLSLGPEQGLVSKANAKRTLTETIQSCVAHVGCDINHAPLAILQQIPGLGEETARKLVERRAEAPFQSREQLRAEGLLSEAQWMSSIAFLRVHASENLLDRTSLHPEFYDLARKLLESVGTSVEESLGRPGVTKGLRRANFDVDEGTWRELMRELSHPGRDPRLRLFRPNLLHPDTDPLRLTKGRVVEGVITNVTSFGAFVDVGLKGDAMIHISEVSQRYLRDARELLSIGQVVRARILDPSGPRMALSLKDVPPMERPERADRPARPAAGGRGRGRGPQQREERPTGDARGRPLGDGRNRGRRGPGRGGPGGDFGRRDRREPGERVDLRKINPNPTETKYSPFADFFGKSKAAPDEAQQPAAPKQPKQKQPKTKQPQAEQPQADQAQAEQAQAEQAQAEQAQAEPAQAEQAQAEPPQPEAKQHSEAPPASSATTEEQTS